MERKMTPEVRRAMARVASMGPDSVRDIELGGQDKVPLELRTRVHLRHFSFEARRRLSEHAKLFPEQRVPLELARFAISDGEKNGVVGWKNWFDRADLLDLTKDPVEIPFSKALLAGLDEEFVWWAFDEIGALTWVLDLEGLESSPLPTPDASTNPAPSVDVPPA